MGHLFLAWLPSVLLFFNPAQDAEQMAVRFMVSGPFSLSFGESVDQCEMGERVHGKSTRTVSLIGFRPG